MGLYINPEVGTKEGWLAEHGKIIGDHTVSAAAIKARVVPGSTPVCLIDNGYFKAAGVAYCDAEIEEFAVQDGRQKIWLLVADDDINKVTNGELDDYRNF